MFGDFSNFPPPFYLTPSLFIIYSCLLKALFVILGEFRFFFFPFAPPFFISTAFSSREGGGGQSGGWRQGHGWDPPYIGDVDGSQFPLGMWVGGATLPWAGPRGIVKGGENDRGWRWGQGVRYWQCRRMWRRWRRLGLGFAKGMECLDPLSFMFSLSRLL